MRSFSLFPRKCSSMVMHEVIINPFLNHKILDWSKLKALTDDKVHVTQKLKFVSNRVENIVGKVENAGYEHFLLFTQCFQKGFYLKSCKNQGLFGKGLILYQPNHGFDNPGEEAF